jgi:hypothetical protein
MAATDFERLVVQLEAQSTKLDKALENITGTVDRKLDQVERRTEVHSQRVTAGFGRAGAAIAGFLSVQAIGQFIEKISESADKLSALSDRTGISVEALQKLGAAGRAYNVETSELNEALDAFVQRLGAASHGQGDLAKVMREHGIAAGEDYVATILQVADAVEHAKTRSEEYRIVTAAMGRSSAELVGFFRQGSAAIKEQMDAFKGGLSPQAVKDLAEFNQHWKEISISFTNMAAGPSSSFLGQLSKFMHDLEAGNWQQKLANVGNFLTLSIPARMFADPRAAVTHNVGVDRGALAKANKPFGGDMGDPEEAVKQIAKLLADLRNSQAQLAQATSAANATALKDTEAYYDEVRRGAKEAADAEILSIDERKKAEIAAIDEKIGRGQDYQKIVALIEQKAAADEAAVLEKRRQTFENINQEEINDRAAAVERLKSLEEQRAVALQRTNEAAIASGSDLVRAQNELAIERTRGTEAYFEASRRAIEDDAALQKGAIKAREETEIASLARLREERFKAGQDGVSVWKQYDQAVRDLNQQTADEIAAVDADAAAKRIRLTEEQTHALENQIAVMDRVRGGLEDVGVAALHGSKDFGSAIVQMLQQLAELSLRLYILRPLIETTFGRAGTTLGGLFGSGGFPETINVTSQIFGSGIPGRAGGGRVSAGMPYIVGENRQPELFIPDSSGTIVPRLDSSSGGQVEVTVFVHPSGEFDARVERVSGGVVARAAPQIAGAAVRQVRGNLAPMMAETSKRAF